MMRLMIAALAVLAVMPARADVFTYKCKAKGKTAIVKVDDVKNTLSWSGGAYKLTTDPECAGLGWKSEDGFVNLCTATQGAADFGAGKTNFDCDLKR